MKPVRHLSDEKRFSMLAVEGSKFLLDLRELPNVLLSSPRLRERTEDAVSLLLAPLLG